MEDPSFLEQIETAIQSRSFSTLTSIFSGPNIGVSERRTLSAHLILSIMNKTAAAASKDDNILIALLKTDHLAGEELLYRALSNLPSSGVEGGKDNQLRWEIFNFKVNEENDYLAAARVLSGLRMESEVGSLYYMTAADMCNVYVTIAECFLEEDETVEADGAVTKAGNILEEITNPEQNRSIILRYKSTYARVLDANRKFLQAASRYLDISQACDEIDPDEQLEMLGRAATCAILAPSGPQRHRVLGLVYKDERLHRLLSIPKFSAHPAVLTKMYMNQILKKAELTAFESSLSEHQLAVTSEGFTIVERAVIEHNMLSVSKIYDSIYLTHLRELLGVDDVRKAERVAAKMIVEGMLKGGEIDQVDGLLSFKGAGSVGDDGDLSLSTGTAGLIMWDDAITNMCIHLNQVTDLVRGGE